jgi:hypothetical protein
LGGENPLEEHELGWEDTYTVPNGQVVQLLVKYEKFAGKFVWHCHILEHEDNEMMRPLLIEERVPEPAARHSLAVLAAWLAAWRRGTVRASAAAA